MSILAKWTNALNKLTLALDGIDNISFKPNAVIASELDGAVFTKYKRLPLTPFPSAAFVDIPDADIPSWATEIEIDTVRGRFTGSANPIAQIAVDGGAIITAGYDAAMSWSFGTSSVAAITAANGFLVGGNGNSGNIFTGTARFKKLITAGGLTTWQDITTGMLTGTSPAGASGSGYLNIASGAGVITKLRLASSNGSDLFNLGSYSVTFRG